MDGTINISEEKELNSGIIHGSFLKRGKLKDENGHVISYADLLIGKDIYLNGRYLTLYDCDKYTRDFYNTKGIVQIDHILPLKDNFHLKMDRKIVKNTDNSMMEYLEFKLGGGKTKNLIQFLENDRKVLKFFAKFENLKYIIHYFLSDDTFEIREVYSTNR